MKRCKTCGKPLESSIGSCPNCGAKIEVIPHGVSDDVVQTYDEWITDDIPSTHVEQGFSKRFDTPEFQKALKAEEYMHANSLIAYVLMLPFVFTLITALVSPTSLSFLTATCLSLYFILILIFSEQIVGYTYSRSWDGEVTKIIHHPSDRFSDTFYIVCRTDKGRKKKVRDSVCAPLYRYLQVGDRVRFHPNLNVPLEKYDKSHDEYVVCSFCGLAQRIENDSCLRCGRPLLK